MKVQFRPAVWTAFACFSGFGTAQTALPDLGTGSYLGQQGGLYPGGANQPPAAHAAAALGEAAQVVPRDTAGNPDPDGLIGMVCLGMSNTSQEFEDLERTLDARTARNPHLVIVNTCAGGQSAELMDQASDLYWSTLAPGRLAAAGVATKQVQVAWMKQAFGSPQDPGFPGHAQALRDTLKSVVQVARATYPNLRLLYVSSRIYGGFVTVQPGSEPFTFETGFGVKWLIEAQIGGDVALNHDSARGPVLAPLLLWGPYLWANGGTPNGNGTTWTTGDYEADHLHPSTSGEAKVGALLTAFFDAEPSATWLAQAHDAALRIVPTEADAYVDAAQPDANFGTAASLAVLGGAQPKRVLLRFSIGGVGPALLHAKLVVRDVNTGLNPVVRLVGDTAWSEAGVTWNTAPAVDGATLSSGSNWTRENCPSFDLTAALRNDADGRITVAIDTPAATEQQIYSRESTLPPQLVLSIAVTDRVFFDGFE